MAMQDTSSAWDKPLGVLRLTNLGNVPPRNQDPHGPFVGHGGPTEDWLQALRHHADARMAPELLANRWDIWRQTPEDLRLAPRWMTLAPAGDLVDYKDLLVEDLELDQRALEPWILLVRRGDHGYSEACRVLYHGLKDKRNYGSYYKDDGPGSKDKGPVALRKWWKNTSNEAHEALNHPKDWHERRRSKGFKGLGKGKDGKDPQGPSSSTQSTSTNPWASYSGNLYAPGRGHTEASKGSGSRSSSSSTTFRTGYRPGA